MYLEVPLQLRQRCGKEVDGGNSALAGRRAGPHRLEGCRDSFSGQKHEEGCGVLEMWWYEAKSFKRCGFISRLDLH